MQKITIFFNTDGFLGGWGIVDYIKPYNLTTDHINKVEASRGTPDGIRTKKLAVRAIMKAIEQEKSPSKMEGLRKQFDDAVADYHKYSAGLPLNTPLPITQKMIDEAKMAVFAEKGKVLVVEMPENDVPLFHGAVDCRDNVEVLPSSAKNFDAQFGNVKLKFNDNQSSALLAKAKEAMALSKAQGGGMVTKHDKWIQEINKV